MLDSLTSRLAGVVKTLRGQARLTEANILEALREVARRAARGRRRTSGSERIHRGVREKAVGEEVIGSLTPARHWWAWCSAN